MKKTTVYLTKHHEAALKRESQRTGSTVAELIRRAIAAMYGKAA